MASENVNIIIKAHDRTKRSFRAVTMGLNAIKKVAFSMQTALIAVGVAGFGYLVKKSLETTDALGKFADKIGIGTAELGGLRHAAELTGVATTTLDMGLQRMVRRVSEAANGSGEAKDALIELGLSAKALNTLAPDQQFRAIADAMEGVAGQGNKVRLAMRLFDTEGVSLVNTLKGGSAALIEIEKKAERLGITLNRDLVKGVEKANDALKNFSSFIGGVFTRTIAELAPAIESITEQLQAWFEMKAASSGGVAQLTKDMAISIVGAARSIVSAFASITNSVIGFGNALGGVSNIYQRIFGDKQTVATIEASIAGTVQQLEMLKNLSKGNDPLIASQAPLIAELQLSLSMMRELIETGDTLQANKDTPLVDVSGTLAALDQVLVKLAEVKLTNDVAEVSTTDTSLVDLTAMTNAQMIDLQDQYEAISEGKAFEHQRKMNEMTRLYLIKQSAIQKIAKMKDIEDLKEEGKDTLKVLSGSFKAAFALNKAFALKDAIVSTYLAVSKALASAPFPINLGLGALALANGMAQVQAIRSTQFREKGGPMSAGSPYIVGERGPELIVPNQAANVIPNDQLGGGNFTINISANDTAGFDQLLMKRRGTIMGLINQSLNERGRPALA
jgi:hypothetical protein